VVVPEHKHLIVRAECNRYPESAEAVSAFLTDLVGLLGMKILTGPHAGYVDQEGNRGATGVVVIETSHCAIHVWEEPDPKLIQIDVYTCGPCDTQKIFDLIKERFDPVKLEYKYLDREHNLIEIANG